MATVDDVVYQPALDPDPTFVHDAANLSQARLDAWNRVAEIAARLAEHEPSRTAALEAELAGVFAFLRGVEGFWVFPGMVAVDRMEELAGLGHMEELSDQVHALAWRLGRFGDAAALISDADLAAASEQAHPERHYFTAVMVSDVDSSVWQSALAELHAFRRPDDPLVYELLLVRSFDAALACVLLNHEVQAVIMRPDVPIRSHTALGLFDGLIDEYDAQFGLTGTEEHHRARVLATVIRRVRPHLDLYLLTDEAVPEPRTRRCWPSTARSTGTSRQRDAHDHARRGPAPATAPRSSTPSSAYARPPDRQLPRPADRSRQLGLQLPVDPGHGRRSTARNIFLAETSSTSGGLDSLLAPTGTLARPRTAAAQAFGAKQTYFVTNGTSTSNKIVVQALTAPATSS